MQTLTKFQPGRSYTGRSIGDHDCIIKLTVAKRTAKTVILDNGKRLRIGQRDGIEFVMPWGRYSMSPGVYADRVA